MIKVYSVPRDFSWIENYKLKWLYSIFCVIAVISRPIKTQRENHDNEKIIKDNFMKMKFVILWITTYNFPSADLWKTTLALDLWKKASLNYSHKNGKNLPFLWLCLNLNLLPQAFLKSNHILKIFLLKSSRYIINKQKKVAIGKNSCFGLFCKENVFSL